MTAGAVRHALKGLGVEVKFVHPPRRTQQQINAGFYWSQVKRLYGLTRTQWDAMLIEQCGRCGCCGELMVGRRDPQVDHNHKTGKVRELLCATCNGLLRAVENIEFRVKAEAYLEKHHE